MNTPTDFLSSSLNAAQLSEFFNSSISLIVTKFWENKQTIYNKLPMFQRTYNIKDKMSLLAFL